MSLGLVKLMLSSIIVDGTVDEESFEEIILLCLSKYFSNH